MAEQPPDLNNEFVVPVEAAGQRLDKFLVEHQLWIRSPANPTPA
jgi:hypothetical protein